MRLGLAGRASVATAETHWYRGEAYYAAARWRGTFAGELGGCLTTHAIHIHDLLCEILGPIASVHARTSNRLNGNETEDMAVALARLRRRRLRHLLGDAGLAPGDVAAALLLRGPRRPRAASRPTTPATSPGRFPHDDPARPGRIAAALDELRAAARALRRPVPPAARRPDRRCGPCR